MKFFILAVTLLLAVLPVEAREIGSHPQVDYALPAPDSGEYVLDFENEESESGIASFLSQIGFRANDYSWSSREERWIRISRVTSEILSRLRSHPDIEEMEPNYYYSALLIPNDPYYKHQWHLDLIGMREAWDYPKGSSVTVAVIDTGIAFEQFQDFFRAEDLGDSQFVKPHNFLKGNEHANDDHGHGTHVAGTIAQLTNNAVGVAGVAPYVRLMPLKVLNAYGYGTLADIAAAIRYAADHGAKVINMSLGGPFPSRILHKAIQYAHAKGVVIVCAAGNSGRSGMSYPARYPECVSVSAVRFDQTLTWYSSYGKGLTIAAPGGDMNVDQNGDGLMDGVLQNTLNPQDPTQQGYFLFQGTSMAAPHVAAAAALLVSHGITDPEMVRDYLQDTATKVEGGTSEKYGAGVLNADAAIRSAFFYRKSRILLVAVIFLILFFSTLNRGKYRLQKIPWSPLALLGLIVGSSGFFFLGFFPFFRDFSLTGQSAPEWLLSFSGISRVIAILGWSAIPAVLVTVLLYPWKWTVSASVGFSVGLAAFLLYHAFSPVADLPFVPGRLLETVWLSLHSLFSLVAALVASFRLR